MKCVNCGFEDTKVLDSRPINDGMAIRRRRECIKCQARFSTHEEMEILDPAQRHAYNGIALNSYKT